MGQIWGFRAFPGECMEAVTSNWLCWCIMNSIIPDWILATVCIEFWLQYVDFPHFGTILTWWKETNAMFTIIILGIIGRNNHNHSMVISQAWNPDDVSNQKGSKGILLMPSASCQFCYFWGMFVWKMYNGIVSSSIPVFLSFGAFSLKSQWLTLLISY